jgi:hypothetical protein
MALAEGRGQGGRSERQRSITLLARAGSLLIPVLAPAALFDASG